MIKYIHTYIGLYEYFPDAGIEPTPLGTTVRPVNYCTTMSLKSLRYNDCTFTIHYLTIKYLLLLTSTVPRIFMIKYEKYTMRTPRKRSWNSIQIRVHSIFVYSKTMVHFSQRSTFNLSVFIIICGTFLPNQVTLYQTCIRSVLTCANVDFAHAARIHISSFRVIWSRFCRIDVGVPWYVRTVDLHHDLQLESIHKYLKTRLERFFEKAAQPRRPGHANPPSSRACLIESPEPSS